MPRCSQMDSAGKQSKLLSRHSGWSAVSSGSSPGVAVTWTAAQDIAPSALPFGRHGNPPPIWRTLFIGASVTAAYVLSAHLGFRLAFVAEQVTTVWAPTGIAIAALLLGGRHLWPAIWAGAFLANAATNAPLWADAIVATGNTLEAVTATYALRRLHGFDARLQSVRDVLAFLFFAAGVSTAISATVGVTSLCAASVQPWSRFAVLWTDWWLGDALGAIVVAPAILTTARRDIWSARTLIEAALYVAASVLIAHVSFGQVFGMSAHPLEFVVFPAVMIAAVAGGPAVTSLVVASIATITIWHTVRGLGPFSGAEVHHSLILLQVFMGVLGSTAMLLAAAVAQSRAAERRERDAATELRHREQMLTLAQRAGGVATFEWDFRAQIARCSAEFFRMFGLPAEEGVMAGAEWGRFVHPEDRDRMATHLARVLEDSEPAMGDYRIVRPDGSTRWLSYAGQIRRTDDGERMLGTVVDITNRKHAELALREAKTAAESANQLKDQFLATLSHELRTPLNTILGYAQMLNTDAIAPEKRQRAMDAIERNAIAQHRLVEDLLDMSRITTGKVRLNPQPIVPETVLRDAVGGVKPAADAKSIHLTIACDPAAGTVTGDAARLQQVLWNVLTNAVKFTGHGGRVDATLQREGDHVLIRVRDNGSGIPAEFLPFVFDPFRQGDAGFDRTFGGLGLGLAIAKQLVELHGGTIGLESAGVGQGATCTIRLPRRG